MNLVVSLLFFLIYFIHPNDSFADTLTISAGVEPPYIIKDGSNITGILPEIIAIVGKRINKEIAYDLVPWKRALAHVESGKVDAICCSGRTKERSRFLYFPELPLTYEENVFFIKKDNNIRIDREFKNVKSVFLGASDGFIYKSLQEALNNNRFAGVYRVREHSQLVGMLQHGRTDVFVGNKITLSYYIRMNGLANEIGIMQESGTNKDWILDSWPIYLAFSKKKPRPPYLEKITDTMQEMFEDGTYERILDKYIK